MSNLNNNIRSTYASETTGSDLGLMSGYSNDVRLSRAEMTALPTPAPQGRFHRPVPFGDYVEEVAHQLDRIGLVPVAEEHILSHDNQRHFGLMEIAAKEGELITSKEWSILLGLRGSHDQSVQRGIALGRNVMVCSNLCFSGDVYTSNTKHTLNIWDRLPVMLFEALSKVPEMAHLEEQRVERMRNFQMKPRWGDAALVEIHRRGGLTAAQLGRSIHQWDRPTFEEHAEQGFTAWRLEQAVTQAVKPTGERSNLFQIQDRTQVASTFINEVVGF